MASPFETFVNGELPKRISTSENPMTLVAGKIPVSLGVGLAVEFVELSSFVKDGASAYDLAAKAGFVGTEAQWVTSLKGVDGVIGINGAPGVKGDRGPMGGGINVIAKLTSVAELPAPADRERGDTYVIDGHFWTLSDGIWQDMGSVKGDNGESAYAVALKGGFGGTSDDWLASLKGEDGIGLRIMGSLARVDLLPDFAQRGDAYVIGYAIYVWDSIQWSPVGQIGKNGTSAYQEAVAGGFSGSPATWLKTLVGKNNYQIAKALGQPNTATELEWVKSIMGIPGPVGPIGTVGPQGIKGDMGAGVTILGSKANASELPATGTLGNGYLIAGHFWGWTGAAYVDLGLVQGPQGVQGLQGLQGVTGTAGTAGNDGPDGLDAYAVALSAGFVGDKAAWLLTLKGAQGDIGLRGPIGTSGLGLVIVDTLTSSSLLPATAAENTTYVAGGRFFVFLSGAWVDMGSLTGDSAFEVAAKAGYVGTKSEWIASLKGVPGLPGAPGATGDAGLKGDAGPIGNTGVIGLTGLPGDEGPIGLIGPMGPGISILGSKNNVSELPATGKLGDGYLIGGRFWGWTGASYVDLGQVQGPQGDKGDIGTPGVDGVNGVAGTPGSKGDTGTIGAGLIPKGTVADQAALLKVTAPALGHTYFIDGHAWSYNGTGWVDMGELRGLTGKSAFDIAKALVPSLTSEAEYLVFLKGDIGLQGSIGLKGDAGLQGAQGDPGVQGLMGPGISIIGTFTSTSQLPATGKIGEGYLITGNFWCWTGTKYEDLGLVQGPRGDKGAKGDTGVQGIPGTNGLKGDKGDIGTKWILLGRDPTAADGRSNDSFLNTASQEIFLKVNALNWATQGHLGGGNVYDAVSDNVKRVRLNGDWEALAVDEAPLDTKHYVRKDGKWAATSEAPSDGKYYVRKDDKWAETPLTDIASGSAGYYVRTSTGWVHVNRYDVLTAATLSVLDLAVCQAFTVSAASSRTLTFANVPPADRAMTAVVTLSGSAGIITWPTGIVWLAGSAPTLGTTVTVVVLFWTGAQWLGTLSGSV